MGQVVVLFHPIPDAETYGNAVNTVFGAAWRIALASFVAYLVAQNFDIWFFHKLRERTQGRHLWLRNLGSTSVSQFIDTVIFFPIAFAGIMPDLLQVMLVAYIIKIIVAVLDTPYIYIAKLIAPSQTAVDG